MRDREINIKRIRNGDIEAFNALFESFYIPLREFVCNFIPARDVAADIAQETLVKYWQRRENFLTLPQVRSFLYNTARNAILNELAHLRVVAAYNHRFSAESLYVPAMRRDCELYDPDYYEIRSEVIRRLRDEISSLPLRTRQIMTMALAGAKNDEIATALNIERETVRSHKKSAHKKLRARLDKYKGLLADYEEEIFS